MRALLVVLALAGFSCATRPPCDPGQALVNATLWMQSAPEYRAAASQTYVAARRALDVALAEAPSNALPPAVILDLDETALDNSLYAGQSIAKGKTFEFDDDWSRWVSEAASAAVPGAREFVVYAHGRGVTPFYITNRTAAMEADTRRNLEALGFPLATTEDTLLTRTGDSTDKTARRDAVAARYRVLLLLGDDVRDFTSTAVTGAEEQWGTRWFMLPNPVYGGWEKNQLRTTR